MLFNASFPCINQVSLFKLLCLLHWRAVKRTLCLASLQAKTARSYQAPHPCATRKGKKVEFGCHFQISSAVDAPLLQLCRSLPLPTRSRSVEIPGWLPTIWSIRTICAVNEFLPNLTRGNVACSKWNSNDETCVISGHPAWSYNCYTTRNCWIVND